MAFVSSSTSSFLGTRTMQPDKAVTSLQMRFGLDKMLEKYDKMTRIVPKSAVQSQPSSVWTAYSKSILERMAPTRRVMFGPQDSLEGMLEDMVSRAFMFTPPGGSPVTTPADAYMAGCVNKQYKQMACSTGEYGVTCTEGTYRGATEYSRVLALGRQFRMGQRSANAKFADYFSNRKMALISTHGCNYEEALVSKYVRVADAMITGISESNTLCQRYVNSPDPAEKYMTDSIDKQNKFRAVPLGVYGVLCQDGAAKDLPEFKRTAALAAQFRSGQIGKIAIEDRKFAAKKFARDYFTHGCNYEEQLFTDFPQLAMSMRYESVRY